MSTERVRVPSKFTSATKIAYASSAGVRDLLLVVDDAQGKGAYRFSSPSTRRAPFMRGSGLPIDGER